MYCTSIEKSAMITFNSTATRKLPKQTKLATENLAHESQGFFASGAGWAPQESKQRKARIEEPDITTTCTYGSTSIHDIHFSLQTSTRYSDIPLCTRLSSITSMKSIQTNQKRIVSNPLA